MQLSTSRVKIIIIIVDIVDVETFSVIGLKGRETALSLNLVGASLTPGKSDIDVLLLTHGVKVEGSVVATATLNEWAHRFGHNRIGVGARTVEVGCVLNLRAGSILATN